MNSCNVLVIAASESDAELLCSMVTRMGHEPSWYSDLSQCRKLLSRNKVTDNVVAVVLCHRACAQDTTADLGVIDLSSQLPAQLRCKRLIVVSDCMDEQTVVSLLNNGAHQCFNLRESPRLLQVRLEAALRWHSRLPDKLLIRGDIVFDVQKRCVTRAGCTIELSPKEYDLAFYLFLNHHRVVGNGELLTSVWSLPAGMDTRRIDTTACRIRKKLRLTAAQGWELKRLRLIGYRLINTQKGQAVVTTSELMDET